MEPQLNERSFRNLTATHLHQCATDALPYLSNPDELHAWPTQAQQGAHAHAKGMQWGAAQPCWCNAEISPSAGRGGETIFISAAFERSADSSLRARLCGRAAAATAAMAPFESLYMKIASEGLGLLVSSYAVQMVGRGGDCSSQLI